MDVTVNGQPVVIPDRSTIRDLLASSGRADQPCAVEVNQALVPRARHEEHHLEPGDAIEIVTLVGGG